MLDTAFVSGADATANDAGQSLPIETRGLSYRIDRHHLLDSIDLTIEAGGITVIMGPNGAGKTLLLRLLHGLIIPTDGAIRWGGGPLTPERRRRQAMVFQRPVSMRRSVAANVEFVLSLHGTANTERCQELLRRVGLETKARQPARLLSGGEQQRLALARALAVEPQVLFLDEPTASLDPASIAAIETIIRETQRGGTKIVLVTHDVGQARRLAGEAIFLCNGRVLEQSPGKRFFAAPSSQAARDYLAGRLVY